VDSWVPVAGIGVGLLYGIFGVGSAVATPVLSLLGVPGLAAVVAPLPALLPSSIAGAWSYARNDNVDRRLARRVIAGALPAAVAGALLSHRVDDRILLALSGLALLFVGVRVLGAGRADRTAADAERAARRRDDPLFVGGAAVVVGFASGLLANGGGFLLVPLFLVLLGLDAHRATGTSLLIAATLTVPTLATHIVVGDIDWTTAGLLAAGLIPGALLGGLVGQHLPARQHAAAFGLFLVAFAAWYLFRLTI
jgi:uncharacterized membrane protein YfcA